MNKLFILTILTVGLTLNCSAVFSDAADNIQHYSESQLVASSVAMAEAVSRSAPSQIDSVTVLLGAIFVKDTKTFIYKYESKGQLDRNRMQQMIPKYTCSDRIRRAFMKRGITIQHIYITPLGQQEISVRIKDCI